MTAKSSNNLLTEDLKKLLKRLEKKKDKAQSNGVDCSGIDTEIEHLKSVLKKYEESVIETAKIKDIEEMERRKTLLKNNILKKSEYDKIIATVNDFGGITNFYYPTVKELEMHEIKKNLMKYVILVAYFASDPYKEQKSNEKEYLDSVKYCQELLSEIKVED